MFITFEGMDGVGKSTQLKLLAESLEEDGYDVLQTYEPGGSQFGQEVRSLLQKHDDIDAMTEMLLFFAARRDHYQKCIAPALESGKIVLCDRFCDSTIVYQGVLRGLGVRSVSSLKEIVIKGVDPDLTIVLDSDVGSVHHRIRERAQAGDCGLRRFDMMDAKQHDIVRHGFLRLADVFSYRCRVITTKKIVDTHRRVRDVVHEFLEQRRSA